MRATLRFLPVLALGLPAIASAQPELLGDLPGGTSATALAVSDGGWVAGQATVADGTTRAFVRAPDGTPVDAGRPAGMTSCVARAVDDTGRAAGFCSGTVNRRLVRRAVVWDAPGAPRVLAGLPGAYLDEAFGLDAAGRVVGQSRGTKPTGGSFARAVLWDAAGSLSDLGALQGGYVSTAAAIGAGGHVVGDAETRAGGAAATHAFRWTAAGGMEDLGLLPGGTFSRATAVNAAGDVAGLADTASGEVHAFVWTSAGGMTDLGVLPDGYRSEAKGLSGAREAVGVSWGWDGSMTGFRWSAAAGLRALAPPAGGTTSAAHAIDAAGNAVGEGGTADGARVAVRWPAAAGGAPPVAHAGADATVDCTGRATAVTLDGSGSRGSGGALAYAWRVDGQVLPPSGDPRTTLDLPVGLHVAELVVTESGRESAPDTALVTVLDAEPPETLASFSPPPNGAGWNRGAVTVALSGRDRCSEVAEVRHAVDASGETAAPGPQDFVTVAGEGRHALSYRSVDEPGNAGAPATEAVRIDATPPTLAATLSPPPNAAGWNTTDVTVTFEAADALSGVAFVSPPVVVTGAGRGLAATGSAEDAAGNAASASVEVNIDRAAPALALAAGGSLLWPPNHKMVNVQVSGRVSDDSGLRDGLVHVQVTSSEPDDLPGSGDGWTRGDTDGGDGFAAPVRLAVRPAADGTFSFPVSLRAERSNRGPGRVYTVAVSATDLAGRVTVAEKRVLVPRSMAGKAAK